MATKRKGRSGNGQHPNKRTKSRESFPLLSLPRELRDAIYAEVGRFDTQTRCVSQRSGKLRCRDALSLANKQVREEYLEAMHLYTTKITAFVDDFEFRYVIAFLNKLNDAVLNSLNPAKAAATKRSFTISLTVDGEKSYRDGVPSCLSRWLRRCAHETKKGTCIPMMYEIFHVRHHFTRPRPWGPTRDLSALCDDSIKGEVWFKKLPPKGQVEMSRIADAMRNYDKW